MYSFSNILDSMSIVPKNRIAFVSRQGELTYGDIYSIYQKNSSRISKLNGKCVCIKGQSRYDFALLLSILDGRVRRIVFIPEDINDKLLLSFYEQSQVDYEVSVVNNVLVFDEVSSRDSYNNITQDKWVTEWVVPTSGTTKSPKLVGHTFLSMSRSTVQDVSKGICFRWGLTFDIYRFSGIQVFLQAVLGGSSLIIPSSGDNIQATLLLFSENKCNVISATPSFWRKAFMVKEISRLSLARVTLGGEIVDSHVLMAIKNKFKNVKVTHIYASTEAGVGFAVTDGLAGFPKAFLNQSLKNNIKLAIKNNILWINPGMQDQEYLSADLDMFDEEGFINTGDIVQIVDDRVYFLGRDSGAINVGGNKVHPEEVEQVILNSGLVNEVYVFAKSNPIMGSLVCADIVTRDIPIEEKDIRSQILEYCKHNLEAFKRPVILKVVPELAISQSGKLKRL